MKDLILLRNNLVEMPTPLGAGGICSIAAKGTILANMAYYGYAPSIDVIRCMEGLREVDLVSWWQSFERTLKQVTGEDKNMGDFVVYKNFPKEVLEMSEAEYWTNQILMYIGFPNEIFTEDVQDREPLDDKLDLKVLHLAGPDSLGGVFKSLCQSPARWTREQKGFANHLAFKEDLPLDLGTVRFKENMASIGAEAIKRDADVSLKSATDVLRLASAMSDGDVSLRTKTKFRRFSRKERRFFLKLLNDSTSFGEDVARRPGQWKKFVHGLHPHDYADRFPRASTVCANLYDDVMPPTFNSKLENALGRARINCSDTEAIELLKQRPGEFTRRLANVTDLFGRPAIEAFLGCTDRLSVLQLLKLKRHVETVNDREFRIFPPKGNWTKAQFVENTRRISNDHQAALVKGLADAIGRKLNKRLLSPVCLDDSAKMVKLQTSDSDLADYGRGTVFPIPDNMSFVRVASYWSDTGRGWGNSWYDNGVNFFDENWKGKGTICWDQAQHPDLGRAAAFSGDPTNSKDKQGRACQVIDLYLDKLQKKGVRYAVWNILCFSHRSFDQANEVFASLQWGEAPEKGAIFDPARCQLAFPLKGPNMTKYIAYIDIEKRQLVYMDANLSGVTSSANRNAPFLEKQMPPFVEYLGTLPTVHDLLSHAAQDENGTKVAYDDSELELTEKELAFVFQPVKEDNSFTQLNLAELLK